MKLCVNLGGGRSCFERAIMPFQKNLQHVFFAIMDRSRSFHQKWDLLKIHKELQFSCRTTSNCPSPNERIVLGWRFEKLSFRKLVDARWCSQCTIKILGRGRDITGSRSMAIRPDHNLSACSPYSHFVFLNLSALLFLHRWYTWLSNLCLVNLLYEVEPHFVRSSSLLIISRFKETQVSQVAQLQQCRHTLVCQIS